MDCDAALLRIFPYPGKWSAGEANQTPERVRQGDLLSPMLFIIVMEVFAKLMATVAEGQLLQPLGTSAIKHYYSLYVIIFMHPSVDETRALNMILQTFGDASGPRTNLAKCTITAIHAPDINLQAI